MPQESSPEDAAATSSPPARPHDRSRRLLFTHRRMVEDLLRGFIDAPWKEELDFDTLEKLSTDFVADGLEERLADVVWEIRRKSGLVYVLILIEFQSTARKYMALRMITYVLLFYQRLLKVRPLQPGEKLPAVLPILFYNGEEEYQVALDMADLIAEVPPELARYQPSMRYFLIDELRWPCSVFAGVRNAVATFLRLQQSDPRQIRELVLDELALDWIEEENEPLLHDLLEWLSLVLLPQRAPDAPVPKFKSLNELKGYMEKDMETWSDMLRAEGRTEGQLLGEARGRDFGRTEGQAAVILSLIEEKFGPADDAVASRVRRAGSGDLLVWAKRILTARRLEDVFNGAGH